MLKDAGGRYFVGNEFSLADIIASSALSFFSPLPKGFAGLQKKEIPWYTDAELATEFKDLVTWRDALYAERRGPSKAA